MYEEGTVLVPWLTEYVLFPFKALLDLPAHTGVSCKIQLAQCRNGSQASDQHQSWLQSLRIQSSSPRIPQYQPQCQSARHRPPTITMNYHLQA